MQSRLNASQTTDNPKAESSGDEPENKSGGASPAEGAEVATEGTVPPPVSFEVEKQSAPSEESFVEGVVAEAKNIEWPALGQVLGSTTLVLALVGGAAFGLLGLNSVLSDLSTKLFG